MFHLGIEFGLTRKYWASNEDLKYLFDDRLLLINIYFAITKSLDLFSENILKFEKSPSTLDFRIKYSSKWEECFCKFQELEYGWI